MKASHPSGNEINATAGSSVTLDYRKPVPPAPFRRLRRHGLWLSTAAIAVLAVEFMMDVHILPWELHVHRLLRMVAYCLGITGAALSLAVWIRNHRGRVEVAAIIISAIFLAIMGLLITLNIT